MFSKTAEKGQALILIAFAAIGLFAFAALAIDGSRVFSDKRHAQNAADTASLAGALAYTRATDAEKADATTIDGIIGDAAQKRATSNSYNNDGTRNKVTITTVDAPDGRCGKTDGKEITVNIVSYVDTTFARVIGRAQVTNAVTATALACGYYEAPPFSGNPIVGLNPDTTACGIDSWNGDWTIKGGGVFSNGCAAFHKTLNLVDDGSCVTSVGPVTDYPNPNTESCYNQNLASQRVKYPDDVYMPPNPCTGAITDGRYAGGGKVPTSGQTTFDNDVFCISNMDALDREDVVLHNATLYVTDTHFDLQFEGQGGFSGYATRPGGYTGSEPYVGYFLIITLYTDGPDSPCTDYTKGDQVLVIRGNSGQDITGSILAPSACLDLRGTSDGKAMDSQIIGYTVTSNGSSTVNVNYDPDDNPKIPHQPKISQWR